MSLVRTVDPNFWRYADRGDTSSGADMTSKISICLAALVLATPMAGCSLLKVNGKPLFGGKNAEPAGGDAAGSTASSGDGGGSGGGGKVSAANSGALKKVIDDGNAANQTLFEAFKKDEVPADALASLETAAKKSAELGDDKSAAVLRAPRAHLTGSSRRCRRSTEATRVRSPS